MSELSSMLFKTITLISLFFLALEVKCSKAQIWIKGGYWHSSSEFPVPNIDSAMFTHIMFAFAHINYSTYELSISSSDEPYFSTFTNIVKQKNPTVQTIVSIWAGDANSANFFSIISQSSQRKSFIESSIRSARRHGFEGLDLWFYPPNMGTNMTNTEKLFDEWRAAIDSESRISSRTPLILVMTGHYSPVLDSMSYPVKSIQKNLNWVHVKAYDFHLPSRENFTGAHTALYDPSTEISTDYGIKEWMARGLPASKMVLGLAFHGFVWTLVNPKDDAIGAPARGPGITADGSMSYNLINEYIKSHGTTSVYNSTYVVNSCTIGSFWIVFDDVEAIRAKVAYAKDKGLLGYIVWQIPNDYNWMLSKAAAQEDNRDHRNKHHLLMILLTTGAAVILLTGTMIWYIWRRVPKSRGVVEINNDSQSNAAGGSTNAPNLKVFSFADMEAATNKFSFENKLGEGGYGPVYKGKLQTGQEIAVKRLSKTSKQGFEEFKNEVMLTAKLQHVNLVRVLGFCTEKEEQMLVYEYMSNKSLDFYIYDPFRRVLLDWEKRVHIIEGVTQGLLYLQEYSRLTVIHRDLKASNILLDNEMKPKISDFGIARTFQKNEFEASTDRIVGTYGYVPPEYVNHGIYSTKSDVYSFGVLVLQIISGKQNNCLHGLQENLNLSDYAFELWKEGNGLEFMDPSLDDTYSSCKLMRCMQIGLLCVQEDPADRPSMLEVLSMLKNETIAMNTPKRPAYSIKGDEDKENESRLREVSCSINQTTITQVVGR